MSEAPKRLDTSALIPFIPRQIMLQTCSAAAAAAGGQKEDKKKRKEETAAIEEKEKRKSREETEAIEEKKEKRKRRKEEAVAFEEKKEKKKRRKEETAVIEEKKVKKKKRKEETAVIEEKKEKKKRSSETLEADSGLPEALALDRPNGGTLPREGERRGIIISSIVDYLESNGFYKTLAVFLSEAQPEVKGGKSSVLNLEDLFCNFLESRKASQSENEILTEKSDGAKLEGAEANKGTESLQKPDKCLQDNEYLAIGKKRKTKKSNENSPNTAKASPSEQLNNLVEHKGDPSPCDSQKEAKGRRLVNGNLEKKEREVDTPSKALEKENRSAEPKTVTTFQRVKIDEVTFSDDRLQDNSYWAKDGADNGYGAKAQEILGQVRGRDFRHEKTKKKRGTYRGGLIDHESHSVKFNYSDEE